MTLPKYRARPGANGAGQRDLTGNGISFDDNQVGDLSADLQGAVVGILLSLPAGAAEKAIENLPEALFSESNAAFVRAGVSAAVDRRVDPFPLAVAESVRSAGIAIPPGLRGQVVSTLVEYATAAPPAATLPWLVQRLWDYSARRRAAAAGQTILDAAWLGETSDLAALVQREAAEVLAMLAVIE